MLVSSATKAPHMEKKMDLYLTSFYHNKSFVLIEKEDQLRLEVLIHVFNVR